MGRWLGAGAGIAALIFAIGVVLDVHALRLTVKLVPVLALMVHAGRSAAPGTERRYVLAGLGASLFGDFFLERDPSGLFVMGLVSFLVAHVLYVVGFTATVRELRVGVALAAYAYGALVLALLGPHLGPMTVPVTVYTLVICTMLWRAGARLGRLEGRRAALALAGAVSFALSDTMIAFSRFGGAYLDEELRRGAPWRLGIMALYWLGQWGIARSLPRAELSEPRSL